MLDNRLVRAINRGRCFVLVGSGPSCEIGYPSWNSLAENTFKQLMQQGHVNDKRSYESYLEQKKYPELFRQAEVDIGSRTKLVDIIKTHLFPATRVRGGYL